MPEGPTIHVLDLKHLGRPRTIAAYLVVGPQGRDGGAVLVETGPASTYETLLGAMKAHGFTVADLRDVLVTHIHLDHAAAAGRVAAEPSFSGRVHVHEFGARHLIDPTRLIESANRIYGQEMKRLWGRLQPVPEERVVPLCDGDVIESAGLRFVAMETPGHAQHHCCFALETPRKPVCFAGDAAGMIVLKNGEPYSIGGAPFINLPTPPPEFDLDLWMASLDRIEQGRFGSLFLTHFGEVRTPNIHLTAVRRALRAHVAFVSSRLRGRDKSLSEDHLESAILDEYRAWTRRQALSAGISEGDAGDFVSDTLLRMNVSGIVRYCRQGGR